MQEKRKKVLICPLNWGLGHAARCIPLINALLLGGAEVIIASSGRPAELLKSEFPELEHLHFPGFEVTYSRKGFSFLKMMMDLPGMLTAVSKEHRLLDEIAKKADADLVISDNRYGCYTSHCKSVFLTHQVNLQLPRFLSLFHSVANNIAELYIKRYDECFIADTALHQLAGDLSVVKNDKAKYNYTGPLSRFNSSTSFETESFEVLVLLSGPEPQRTVLENKLLEALQGINKKVLFIRGLPGESEKLSNYDDIHFENHLSSKHLNFHLLKSNYIICRSGYSSIMDLAVTGRSAIIIPTPGQTEQEYLAAYHHKLKHHIAITQDQLNLAVTFEKLHNCKPLKLQSYIGKVAIEILSGV